MERSRTFKIALGGICLALTIVFMFGGSFIPGIDLTLFGIASLFTAVMIIETGLGGGILLFVAACLLGLFLVPNKPAMLPYICFFGYWPILKILFEKINNAVAQIACKAIFFVIVLCVLLLGFQELFASAVSLPEYPVILLIIAGVILLLLYDFILTFLINYYYRRVKHVGGDDLKLS